MNIKQDIFWRIFLIVFMILNGQLALIYVLDITNQYHDLLYYSLFTCQLLFAIMYASSVYTSCKK